MLTTLIVFELLVHQILILLQQITIAHTLVHGPITNYHFIPKCQNCSNCIVVHKLVVSLDVIVVTIQAVTIQAVTDCWRTANQMVTLSGLDSIRNS